MLRKIIQWIIFGVVLAIVPLVVALLIRATRGQSTELVDLLRNGELLLVTAGIVGAAIGDLLGGNRTQPIFELFSGGACVLILVVSSILYADVSAAHASQQPVNIAVIERSSLWLFSGGVVSSFFCVVFSEL
ncbi:hypothetical protein [Microcystis panniformis]|uniref:hypothetical protein n=1 Tax=Microcystis panniformis TaxID=513223 RepID=UPI00068A8D77|nr:hypothetical protein [Microcystis panniformis]